MRLELAKMKAAPGKIFRVSGDEGIAVLSWWDEKLLLDGPVHVDAAAFYQDEQVHITLRVQGRIHRRCSRCLRDLVEVFNREEEMDIPIDDPTAQYLEFGPIIESGVRLAVSQRPLCQPDCRGICPRCGADLNLGGHLPGCDAKLHSLDPRLAKLKELL